MTVRRALTPGFALLLLAGAAAAQPAPGGNAQSERGPWNIGCAEAPPGTPRPCRLSTTITLRPQNQRVAGLVVLRQPETGSLGLVFQVPHGVLLPAGMTWQVDEGEVQRLAFQTSEPDGLLAGVPLTDDLLAALRRATVLRMSFVIAARRETLTMPVPMNQFTEAMAQLFEAERRGPAADGAPRR